uniref:Uncharacterized protein n=1 Tax=Romanomermis culicivorax TaxID=13658 RepID=A0A915K3Q8_ROMCU
MRTEIQRRSEKRKEEDEQEELQEHDLIKNISPSANCPDLVGVIEIEEKPSTMIKVVCATCFAFRTLQNRGLKGESSRKEACRIKFRNSNNETGLLKSRCRSNSSLGRCLLFCF